MDTISYDDFKKMDIRVGVVQAVEPIPDTDKLLCCQVDFGGEFGVRQIVSGIREYFPDYESLVGRQLTYIVNLEPRVIRGYESQGMILAVGESNPAFLVPSHQVEAGSKVR